MKRALVLSLIFAVGLGFAGFAQTLTGYWDTDITIDLTGALGWPDDISVVSRLVINYAVGDWTFSSDTKITNGGWTWQDFDFAGVLGAFTISGDLEFSPLNVDPFDSLEVNATVSIAGVTFGAYFDLSKGGTDLILTGSGVAGDVSIGVTLKLGNEIGCDFDFNYAYVDIGFPFCCADVSSRIYFSCLEGFEYVWFKVSGITIENLPWLTLSAKVTFEEQTKTFTLSPSIDLGLIGCDFDLYYRLDTQGGTLSSLNVEGIIFDGLQIACEIGGVQFTGITYFGPWIVDVDGDGVYDSDPGIIGYPYNYDKNWNGVEDPGENRFFEAYQIATTDDGCCGPFSFDVTVFFDEASTSLFDVAYLVANMEIQVATQFTFSLGLETDIDAGTVNDLTLGFLVEW